MLLTLFFLYTKKEHSLAQNKRTLLSCLLACLRSLSLFLLGLNKKRTVVHSCIRHVTFHPFILFFLFTPFCFSIDRLTD